MPVQPVDAPFLPTAGSTESYESVILTEAATTYSILGELGNALAQPTLVLWALPGGNHQWIERL